MPAAESFTQEAWKANIAERLQHWQSRLQRQGAPSVYAFLSAAPAAVPTATATKDTIAVTVRLETALYLALKGRGVSYRPRKTNQEMIVEAIKVYLAQAKE